MRERDRFFKPPPFLSLLAAVFLTSSLSHLFASHEAPETCPQQIAALHSALQTAQAQIATLLDRVPPDLGSIQIVAPKLSPTARCVNNCPFCNAGMDPDYDIGHWSQEDLKSLHPQVVNFYKKRLQRALRAGIDTIVITGVTEAQQNIAFLQMLALILHDMGNPFDKVEFQTTGVLLTNDLLTFMARDLGVTRINLSVSALDSAANDSYIHYGRKVGPLLKVDIHKLINRINAAGMRVRLSVNWTDYYNSLSPEQIIETILKLGVPEAPNTSSTSQASRGVDQVTFRRLYESGRATKQDLWIREHRGSEASLAAMNAHIVRVGEPREVLPFGAQKFSVQRRLGVAVDRDCMNASNPDHARYWILYPKGLFTHWRDDGSCIE